MEKSYKTGKKSVDMLGKAKVTKTDIQMRFADIDILGHVNNVNLQHYFDIGKDAYFHDVMQINMDWSEVGILTVATSTSYLAQTRPRERVYVETTVEKIGTKSITIFQRLLSHDSPEVKGESHSVLVAFDFKEQVTVPIPRAWVVASSLA